jgi:hypothetical protein
MVALLFSSDLVETACRVDRVDLADRHPTVQTSLAILESFARPTPAPWILALMARCKALLQADWRRKGFFDEALERHAGSERPFDEARTRLLYGEFLRRTRRRGDARTHLRRAIDTFERLGASPWEERARLSSGRRVRRSRGGYPAGSPT